MNIDEHTQRQDAFRNALKRLYETKDGKLVLDTLKDVFSTESCLGKDPHMTYYNLGKADLVIFIFESLKSN